MFDWTHPSSLSRFGQLRLVRPHSFAVLGVLCLLLVGCRTVSDATEGAGEDEAQQVSEPSERHPPAPLRASAKQPSDADEHAGVGRRRPDAGRFVFNLTNDLRVQHGKTALSWDSTLAQIACWHNQDMLVHDYLGHRDADGEMPDDRRAWEHRRLIGTVGENVAEGEPLSRKTSRDEAAAWARNVLKRWMNSEGHRTNILRSAFTHLGTCVTQTASKARITQLFAHAWGYLDPPLPWAAGIGDSLVVSFKPSQAAGPPAEYAFVPVGEPLEDAFVNEERRQPFRGVLSLPGSTGVYGGRFLVPEGEGQYEIIPGPRVSVEGEGDG